MEWEVVIGLETHTQLTTASKIFLTGSTGYGAAPNTQANEVDMALPGTLPAGQQKAVNLLVGQVVKAAKDMANLTRKFHYCCRNG